LKWGSWGMEMGFLRDLKWVSGWLGWDGKDNTTSDNEHYVNYRRLEAGR
jgi:hypothetical protein